MTLCSSGLTSYVYERDKKKREKIDEITHIFTAAIYKPDYEKVGTKNITKCHHSFSFFISTFNQQSKNNISFSLRIRYQPIRNNPQVN